MKKLFVLLCLFVAAVAMGSNAFAQKADVSYYGGVLKYQKYEQEDWISDDDWSACSQQHL